MDFAEFYTASRDRSKQTTSKAACREALTSAIDTAGAVISQLRMPDRLRLLTGTIVSKDTFRYVGL